MEWRHVYFVTHVCVRVCFVMCMCVFARTRVSNAPDLLSTVDACAINIAAAWSIQGKKEARPDTTSKELFVNSCAHTDMFVVVNRETPVGCGTTVRARSA